MKVNRKFLYSISSIPMESLLYINSCKEFYTFNKTYNLNNTIEIFYTDLLNALLLIDNDNNFFLYLFLSFRCIRISASIVLEKIN